MDLPIVWQLHPQFTNGQSASFCSSIIEPMSELREFGFFAQILYITEVGF